MISIAIHMNDDKKIVLQGESATQFWNSYSKYKNAEEEIVIHVHNSETKDFIHTIPIKSVEHVLLEESIYTTRDENPHLF